MTERELIRDLASQLAEVIRRMGANYGSAQEWRDAFSTVVAIMEQAAKAESA